MVNELVSGVELTVMQRLSVDIKIHVNLRESWQNGRCVNTSDHMKFSNGAP